MNYLLLTLEYFPFKGGVANYYTNLVYYWPKYSKLFILNNNNHDLLRRRGFFRWSRSIFKSYRFIKKNDINHVVVGHILPLGITMFIINKILKTKYSIIIHGMDLAFAIRSPWKRFISKMILRQADKIISANSYTANLCLEFLGKNYNNKIKVVNPGAKDFSDFNNNQIEEIKIKNNLEGHKILFSLGRLVRRKGFDNVIMAMKKIIENNSECNLLYIVAGKGPDLEYLQNLSFAKLGRDWGNYVKFIGEISESEKWSLFSLCDIFIMPSRNISGDFEGFGIVYLEANLAKKPVIAGNSGGVTDAVEQNINGLLVDPENVDEISEAILYLINNNNIGEIMGEQGRERVLKSFNWKKQVEDIYIFLEK